MLIEHCGGAFPLWLAPVQLVVMSITDAQAQYAEEVAGRLREAGFRVQCDLRNEKITYKIREHSLQKVPYQLILGDKERAQSTAAVRNRKGENVVMELPALIDRLRAEVASRSRTAE